MTCRTGTNFSWFSSTPSNLYPSHLECQCNVWTNFFSFCQVRRCILSWLDESEVLKCATVSTTWWSQVQSLMNSYKCLANIWSCEEFSNLNSLVRDKGQTLINGLNVKKIPNHECSQTSVASHLEARLARLTSLHIRYLHICVNTCSYQRRLLHHIVLNTRDSLKELRLNYLVRCSTCYI